MGYEIDKKKGEKDLKKMVKQSRKKSKSMSKVAAQNCRKRKLDQLDDLQVGVPSFCVKQKNRV